MKKAYTLILFLLSLCSVVFAQENRFRLDQRQPADTLLFSPQYSIIAGSQATLPDKFSPILESFIGTPKDIASFVEGLNDPKLISDVLVISSLTGVLNITDHNAYRNTRKYYFQNDDFHQIAGTFVNIGDGKYHLILAGTLLAGGWLFNDSRLIKTAGNIAESMFASGLLVQALKRVSGRESPIASSMPSGKWRTFPKLAAYQKNQAKYYAFPSGHMTTTISTLTVIANNFPELTWLRPTGYLISAAVASGLVAKGMHWYSDFPLAVALGYSFGNIIAPMAKASDGETVSRFTIAPLYHHKEVGLQISYAMR